MGAVRIAILVVAAVAAVALMLIVGSLIKHKPAAAAALAASKPVTRVVVAAHDLQIGSRLSAQDLSWQPWPADAINAAFITDGQATTPKPGEPEIASHTAQVAADAAKALAGAHSPMDALVGAIVKEPILANEPVTNLKLVRDGEGGYMAVMLHPGMRAIAVPASVTTAAGGFVLPGDRVDVLQARQVDMGGSTTRPVVAQTLLRNIRVLAIDQTPQPPKGGTTVVGAVATLEVRSEDTEVVTKARMQGDVILALRPFSDAGGPSGRGGGDTINVGSVRIVRNGQPIDQTVTP
jgi:pilus assembly protein CpaB